MPSPVRNDIRIETANQAAGEAITGAGIGLLKWGAVSLLGSFAAFYISPIYRNLTIQFRVYLWMCPTTLGSMLEAETRLRRYENMIREFKRQEVEQAREDAMVEEIQRVRRLEEKMKAERAAGN